MPPKSGNTSANQKSEWKQVLPKHRKSLTELVCDDIAHLRNRCSRCYYSVCIVVENEVCNERQENACPPREHGGNVDQVFERALFFLSSHETFSSRYSSRNRG